MKTIVLLLVVLVASCAFAWPNLRETEQQPTGDDNQVGETSEQDFDKCERHLKCEVEDDGNVKRQEETDEENKEACERLFEEAKEELEEDDKSNTDAEEESDQKERETLLKDIQICQDENKRVDCEAGSKPEARFLRRMLRNIEAKDCLEAVKKAGKRKGEASQGKCRCESKESGSDDEDSKGRGDRKGRPKPDENKEDLNEKMRRLLRLLEEN